MTNARQPYRNTKNLINEIVNNKIYFKEGFVIKTLKSNQMCVVKIPPNNFEHYCRVSYINSSENSIIGAMPEVGSRVLLAFIETNNYQYDDPIVIACISDNSITKLNNLEPTQAQKDPNSFNLIPVNGGSIHIYYDNGAGKHVVELKGRANVLIKSEEKVVVQCDNIQLGEDNLSDDNFLVTKKQFNQFVDVIDQFLTTLSGLPVVGPAIGVFYSTVWTPQKLIFTNSTSFTTKVKGK